MSMHFRDIAEKAAADGAITAEEILALRREGWADGRIGPDEAEAIFRVNDQLAAAGAEWSDFFVEALGEFIVNAIEPKGYVSEQQGEWLIGRIDRDGRVESLTELELLVRLSERALSVPPPRRRYALAQIERAVLTGEGPTRDGGALEKGNVTQAEARLLRRIIFASGSERPAAVSGSEADLLYRIKDATIGANNAPEWKQLFVQGVGNYLAGYASGAPLERDRAAELEAFMNDSRSSIGGFLGRMANSVLREDLFGNIGNAAAGKGTASAMDARIDEARRVDVTEQTWLESRIDGNGQVDEYDQALLDFLKGESGFTR